MPENPSRGSSPVGKGGYVVQQGDCIFSIAARRGHAWQSIWDHPDNATLREARGNPGALLRGDLLSLPERHEPTLAVTAGAENRYKAPAQTRLKLRFMRGTEAVANEPVLVTIAEGNESETQTDGDGRIDVPVPMWASVVAVAVGRQGVLGYYEVGLGWLDPAHTISGVQGRLRNLGLYCGPIDGAMHPLLRTAVIKFQRERSLTASGEIDDATRDALVEAHGC